MTEPLAYLNGQFLPATQARLPYYDAGVVLGATVTEQARTFRHRPFRLEQRVGRLFRSLRYTQMEVDISREQLLEVFHDLLTHNLPLVDEADELGMLVFVTAGEYRTYAPLAAHSVRTQPTICVHTFTLPFELWAHKFERGAHLVTPSVRHVPPVCFDPKMKCRSRMHFYLAEQHARLVDPHANALLLDLEGNLTETSAGNVLLVLDGALHSPTTRNILPGFSRATVIELAHQLQIPFYERDLQVYDALNADEVFTTSTPYCMLPVTRINGSIIGSGQPGPVFHRLLRAWSEHVQVDIHRQMVEGARRRGPS